MAERGEDPLEQAFLRAYPNPERIGCPGKAVLLALARKQLPIEHPAYLHLGECSPCFGEFKQLQQSSAAYQRRLRLGAIAAGIVLLSCTSTYLFLQQPWQDHRRNQAVVNLQEHPVFRGDEESLRLPPPIVLPRGTLDLHIQLPVASESGTYEVEFVQPGNEHPVAQASGQAYLTPKGAELHVMTDSPLRPGAYLMGVRRVSSRWQTYEVTVGK